MYLELELTLGRTRSFFNVSILYKIVVGCSVGVICILHFIKFTLRQHFVNIEKRIGEPKLKSCGIALLCDPCSMGQMGRYLSDKKKSEIIKTNGKQKQTNK